MFSSALCVTYLSLYTCKKCSLESYGNKGIINVHVQIQVGGGRPLLFLCSWVYMWECISISWCTMHLLCWCCRAKLQHHGALFLHYATRRGVHQLKIIMESLYVLLLYLLFASLLLSQRRGKRDCLFAYQEQNQQRPIISILISSATPRDLILGCGGVSKKKCVHTHNTSCGVELVRLREVFMRRGGYCWNVMRRRFCAWYEKFWKAIKKL